MPTDWLNMPELPRDVLFPTVKRRFWVGVLYIFTLSITFILWSLFQQTLVRIILAIVMWPFGTTRWVIGYMPPFEGTPGPAGERMSLAAVYWDHSANIVQETSQVTVGQLYSSQQKVEFLSACYTT